VNALKAIVRVLADRAARSYVAGPHLSDAIDYASALERDGMSSTVAYWNAVGDDPADVCTAYLSAIDAIAAAGLRSYVSIKAPALSNELPEGPRLLSLVHELKLPFIDPAERLCTETCPCI